jgi:hypothetical protein
VSLDLFLFLWFVHDHVRNIVQRIEVEVLGLNEALANMKSQITQNNEPSEYELLSTFLISSHGTPS